MRILVLGSGAREHALAWKLSQEANVSHVVCAPGNPGIARTVSTTAIDLLDTHVAIYSGVSLGEVGACSVCTAELSPLLLNEFCFYS